MPFTAFHMALKHLKLGFLTDFYSLKQVMRGIATGLTRKKHLTSAGPFINLTNSEEQQLQ